MTSSTIARAGALLLGAGLLVLTPTSPSQAQGWLPWGGFFDGPRTYEPPRRYYDYDRPLRRYDRDRQGRRKSREAEIKNGGAQPDISPKAPPIVAFPYTYPVASIVIDQSRRKLYYVIQEGRAYEYPIAVGREGFSWTGTETVSRKQSWPDWHPPPEMRARDTSLPKKMTGGVRNPLGAVALYLGDTQYRIHGTNDAKSIGSAQSSGCFRMINSAALHLSTLADVGTVVTVVDGLPSRGIDRLSREPREKKTDGRR